MTIPPKTAPAPELGGPERLLARASVVVAVVVALGVAVVGGVRSFDAVSVQFGSVLVPLTADGMIIACTVLRLAALTRGWRLPGSLLVTYGFIVGTVALNMAASRGWADQVAHALAPISYAVLVEMLAHLLRLHLRLTQPARPQLGLLTWVTSPVVSTRVWLHLARTGDTDPVAARGLIQQLIRLSSRLRTVCPGRWPFGRAAAARAAAIQTVRDGLLPAKTFAGLLPDDGAPLQPGALLALIDRAALNRPALDLAAQDDTTPPVAPDESMSGVPARTEPDAPVRTGRRPQLPHRPDGGVVHHKRTDADLVAELHRHGGPLSARQVMRLLSVGTPKAARLVRLAGWAPPEPAGAATGPAQHLARPNARAPHAAGPLHIVTNPTGGDRSEVESDDQSPSPKAGPAR